MKSIPIETSQALKTDGKFLIFNLNGSEYGIPILKVNEIIGILPITSIPKSFDYIKGIINLRGKIIPVMDLRLKFGMSKKEYDANTCIIIINLGFESSIQKIGVIVDIVSEVCTLNAADISPPPDYGNESETSFLYGIGKIKNKVVILLDIEKVILSQSVLNLLKETEQVSQS